MRATEMDEALSAAETGERHAVRIAQAVGVLLRLLEHRQRAREVTAEHRPGRNLSLCEPSRRTVEAKVVAQCLRAFQPAATESELTTGQQPERAPARCKRCMIHVASVEIRGVRPGPRFGRLVALAEAVCSDRESFEALGVERRLGITFGQLRVRLGPGASFVGVIRRTPSRHAPILTPNAGSRRRRSQSLLMVIARSGQFASPARAPASNSRPTCSRITTP